MDINENCAILVTTCDKYDDVWYPFFELFKIMWADCPYRIYLNTETKEYSIDGLNIKALHPYSLFDKRGNEVSWSRRLREVVEQIDCEYILFFLEDFFLKSPVRTDVVEKCLSWMESDDSVGVIEFFPEKHGDEIFCEEFSLIDREYDYCINTMTAIWRKDFLLSILRDENPWDFEFFATERWRKRSEKIYTHRSEFPAVFDYSIDVAQGYGVFQGKWLRKNQQLFEKHGIHVNFEKRGFVDPPSMVARNREKNWIINDFKKTLRKPILIKHYVICTYNVLKDKIRRFRAKYLNP